MFNVYRAVLIEEVLDQYRDHGKEINGLKVAFEGEEEEDIGGLTKYLLTNFWIQAIEKYFKWDNAVVPHLSVHQMRRIRNDYLSLGRVLSHTAAFCQCIPSRLSRSSLLSLIFGTDAVSDEVAVSDFLLYVSYVERCLLVKARNDFSNLRKTDVDDLISIYSMYGLLELPKANLIEDQKKTHLHVPTNNTCEGY